MHKAAFPQGQHCFKVKISSDKEYSIFNYNLPSLDMDNGPSLLYQTNRKIPLVYKGLQRSIKVIFVVFSYVTIIFKGNIMYNYTV